MNSAVLSRNSQWSMFVYYHVLLMYFSPEKGREALRQSLTAFRCLTSGRELPNIPANQAKFAEFAHTSCELCEFHAFCTKINPHLVHFYRPLTIDREH